MSLSVEPITQVLVPGRAHDILPDGTLTLSASSVARVETVSEYYHDNVDAFTEHGGVIVFEGGWASAATGIKKPPEEFREGRLMTNLGIKLGIAPSVTRTGIESTTTMANCLNPREVFRHASRIAIVTQLSQADRFIYCAKKVYPNTAVEIIEAPGEDDPEIIADEQRLLKQSKLLYGWAWGPRTLRLADDCGKVLGRFANVQPGARYTVDATS